MQGIYPKLSGTPGQIKWVGQALGGSNQAIYGDILGKSSEELDDLKAKGII